MTAPVLNESQLAMETAKAMREQREQEQSDNAALFIHAVQATVAAAKASTPPPSSSTSSSLEDKNVSQVQNPSKS